MLKNLYLKYWSFFNCDQFNGHLLCVARSLLIINIYGEKILNVTFYPCKLHLSCKYLLPGIF